MQYIMVFITAPNKKEANRISSVLIDRHLAACVNIIGSIDSHFWWKSKKERAKESLLIAKTTKTKLKKLILAVRSNHSYEVPEVVAIPIVGGYNKYLDWVGEAVL